MTQQRNTVSGESLLAFVERLERLRADKQAISDDEKVVFAEAQAQGFVPKMLRHVLKVRASKPSDYQEGRALADMYLASIGMAVDVPLFRAAGLMSVDVTAKEQVIEALKQFTPHNGSIVIEAGGAPVRLTRGADGEVTVADVVERKAAEPALKPGAKPKPVVPDCSADEAEAMGRQAARDDAPIIANPFPFGDARRPRWDLGWRNENGNDGMGG